MECPARNEAVTHHFRISCEGKKKQFIGRGRREWRVAIQNSVVKTNESLRNWNPESYRRTTVLRSLHSSNYTLNATEVKSSMSVYFSRVKAAGAVECPKRGANPSLEQQFFIVLVPRGRPPTAVRMMDRRSKDPRFVPPCEP